MIAMPDPSTFTLLPFGDVTEPAIARMFCNIQEPDGTPYAGDPRQALKENLKKAKSMGYDFYVGPELEYFYIKNAAEPEALDAGGYFDLTPHDVASPLRTETVLALEKMGIKVEKEHTDKPGLAEEIAMDHLTEMPDYYTRLKKMEEKAGVKH